MVLFRQRALSIGANRDLWPISQRPVPTKNSDSRHRVRRVHTVAVASEKMKCHQPREAMGRIAWASWIVDRGLWRSPRRNYAFAPFHQMGNTGACGAPAPALGLISERCSCIILDEHPPFGFDTLLPALIYPTAGSLRRGWTLLSGAQMIGSVAVSFAHRLPTIGGGGSTPP
jgi:hypothetical protein